MPSSKNLVHRIFYIAAFLFLAGYIIATISNANDWAGWLLAFFFLSLAIGFRSHQFLKGFWYTVMILAVVSLAMYYPHYFSTVGGVKLSSLLIPLLQIIMFGMGTELSLKDFANVIRMPKGIIIGVVC